jgi:VWFA-related protein
MFRRPVLALWTIVGACAIVAAQSGAPPPPATQTPQPFRTRVDAISVDVTVVDKQGNPVTDLKQEDFEIRETGKPQTIDSFRFIKMETTEARGLEPPRQILSMQEMVRETANPQNRLFIVFLDDYHTRESNSMFIRKELARWVQGLTSHDLVALLYPWQDALAATFTRDHDGTAAAIMKFTGRKYDYRSKSAYEDGFAHYPPEYQEQIRNDLTIRTLQSACALLASLRDGRKTLLYVSEGMFATLPAGVRTNSNFSPPITPGTNQKSSQETSYEFFRSSDLLLHLRDVFQVAGRGNTVIYTLDPRGLATSEFGAADSVGTDADHAILTESTDLLRTVADETNGRALVGKNNPLPDLQKMVEEVSAYYLLGYTSTLAPRDGKFHEIQVKVNRKDVDVRARKGYWAYSEEEIRKASAPAKPGPPAEIAAALETLANNVEPTSQRDVVLWLGTARGETEKANATLVWEAPPGVLSTGADHVDQISIVATSGTAVVFKGEVPRDPTALRPAGKVSFDAPAGPIRIRVTPMNARGQKLDTSDLIDAVPDFSTPATTITDPQMFRASSPYAIGQIRKTPSPLPSASRLFLHAERILVRFDVYAPGAAPPQVTLRVLSRAGTPLNDLPAPTLLSGHTFEADINLATFTPPGDFILEITAATGADKTVKLVAIRVKG